MPTALASSECNSVFFYRRYRYRILRVSCRCKCGRGETDDRRLCRVARISSPREPWALPGRCTDPTARNLSSKLLSDFQERPRSSGCMGKGRSRRNKGSGEALRHTLTVPGCFFLPPKKASREFSRSVKSGAAAFLAFWDLSSTGFKTRFSISQWSSVLKPGERRLISSLKIPEFLCRPRGSWFYH